MGWWLTFACCMAARSALVKGNGTMQEDAPNVSGAIPLTAATKPTEGPKLVESRRADDLPNLLHGDGTVAVEVSAAGDTVRRHDGGADLSQPEVADGFQGTIPEAVGAALAPEDPPPRAAAAAAAVLAPAALGSSSRPEKKPGKPIVRDETPASALEVGALFGSAGRMRSLLEAAARMEHQGSPMALIPVTVVVLLFGLAAYAWFPWGGQRDGPKDNEPLAKPPKRASVLGRADLEEQHRPRRSTGFRDATSAAQLAAQLEEDAPAAKRTQRAGRQNSGFADSDDDSAK